MTVYRCGICAFEYDEAKEGIKWNDLGDDWLCPVCQAPRTMFKPIKNSAEKAVEKRKTKVLAEQAVTGSDNKTVSRNISDVMVETMINWGVEFVFGMVGHSNLGLAEAMRKQCEAGRLKFIGIRHEGAASFAASAYGKLTGNPAACLAIAGPGATNMLTGLWDAKLDRVPVLALTGQVDLQFLGPGSFQEIDLSAAFESVSGFRQTVLNESNHVELMNLALKSAKTNRDVANLIFPNQIQEIEIPDDIEASDSTGRLPLKRVSPQDDSVKDALELINKASRPVLIVGNGARFCMPEVIQLAEHLKMPVITTFKGKGLISDHHPLSCGVLGLSGIPVASHFMGESDLLIVLGASFSRHTGILKDKPTIQVDFDPMILGKFHKVTVPVWGEIGMTVDILMKSLLDYKPETGRTETIADHWQKWRDEKEKLQTMEKESILLQFLLQ